MIPHLTYTVKYNEANNYCHIALYEWMHIYLRPTVYKKQLLFLIFIIHLIDYLYILCQMCSTGRNDFNTCYIQLETFCEFCVNRMGLKCSALRWKIFIVYVEGT